MARTLYLNDGSTEYIFAGMTSEDVLQKIIYERLGRDCEELYKDVLTETRQNEDGEDWEKIADGYLSMLRNTVEELDAALTLFDNSRLDRAKLHKQLQAIRKNLHNNL